MSAFIGLSIHFILFVIINAIRFLMPRKPAKMLFVTNFILFTFGISFWLGFESLIWTSLLIPFALVSAFMWRGALISIVILFVFFTSVNIYSIYHPIFLYGGYIIYTLFLAILFQYIIHQNTSRRTVKRYFYRQSKNLHVLREVSLALQSTLQQHKLMHIFLTAVTAGYGLGFNRAMIFIQNEEDQTQFSGRAAIGPLSIEEGHQIWENVVSQRLTLRDFIKLQKEAEENDQELNIKVRECFFQLSEESEGLWHVVQEKDPIIINNLTHFDKCSMMKTMKEKFGVEEMAVIPLLTRGRVIGIMLIDNIVDQKKFTYEDLDNIMPLATQGAMAIENAMLYEQTQELVMTDGLTGLRNKRYLENAIPDLYERAIAKQLPLSALMIDLDYFKNYNDMHGHLMGDQILVQVSGILLDQTPKQGVCVRFGGEEFSILIPAADEEEAELLAERIREKIAGYPFPGSDLQPLGYLSASIGVCSYPSLTGTPEDLIEKADQAVYISKETGRNRVTVFKRTSEEVNI